MDIQELVDRRIAELQGEQVTVTDEYEYDVDNDSSRSVNQPARDEFDLDLRDERPLRKRRRSTDGPYSGGDINRFCEVVDAALVEVAGRVMEIAERVTEDHARLEKELLDLRLETLENAESVLDMALSVRKRARRMIAENTGEKVQSVNEVRRGFTLESEGLGSKIPAVPGDRQRAARARASMHDVGVASLFRKTH